MTDPKKKSYENQAATIIKNLAKRKMQGFYCEDVEAAKKSFQNYWLIVQLSDTAVQ